MGIVYCKRNVKQSVTHLHTLIKHCMISTKPHFNTGLRVSDYISITFPMNWYDSLLEYFYMHVRPCRVNWYTFY